MKTSTKTKLLTLMAVSTLSIYNVNAQTALSGGAAASNGCGAGNAGGSTNTSVGCVAGASNTTGTKNTATGDSAMYSNTATGNSAFGFCAMKNNSSGVSNDAFGTNSMYANTTGTNNSAHGISAMAKNTTGSGNSAAGFGALNNTLTSNFSTAMGYEALLASTGTYNTGFGSAAGRTITSGTFNTFVGGNSDASVNNLTNAGAFGYNSVVGSSNTVMLGNTTTTLVTSNPGFWTTSDGRFKTNVKENVKGLAFIQKLRPVTYNMDTKKLDDFMTQNMSDEDKKLHKDGMDFTGSTSVIHSGFIAQEVEQAGKATGFVSDIVHTPANANETYAVNYAEIVVPLVKAVQEQQAMIEQQQQQINDLKKLIAGGTTPANQNNTNSTTGINTQQMDLSDAVVLNQNQPNPFAEQTLINFNIPQNAGSAQILFYDISGKQIKTQSITTKGQGSLNVYASDLSNGTYSYTLVIDGKVIDTKKMIKQQ